MNLSDAVAFGSPLNSNARCHETCLATSCHWLHASYGDRICGWPPVHKRPRNFSAASIRQ
jgi:hypothetical protein